MGYRIPVNMDINEWLLSFLTCGDAFSTYLLCTRLWKIWKAQNMCLYPQKKGDPNLVANKALDNVLEFNKRNPNLYVEKPQS